MSNQIARNSISSYLDYYTNQTLGVYPFKVNVTTLNSTPLDIGDLPLNTGQSYILDIEATGTDGTNYDTMQYTVPFYIINATTTLVTPLYQIGSWNIPNSQSTGPITINIITGGGVSIILTGSSTNTTKWTISVNLYFSTSNQI